MTDDRIKFDYVRCSETIRDLREAKKESHASLGNAVSISEQALKNYEQAALYKGQSTGKDRVTKIAGMNINNLCKLADHFGVSTDYLLGRSGIQTADANIQAACKTTGLTEKAIKVIKEQDIMESWILSELIETDGFVELIIDISELYETAQILEDVYSYVTNGTPLIDNSVPSNPEDLLIRLYDHVRLEQFELRERFAAIVERVIPTKDNLSKVKELLRQYGGLSASDGFTGRSREE